MILSGTVYPEHARGNSYIVLRTSVRLAISELDDCEGLKNRLALRALRIADVEPVGH